MRIFRVLLGFMHIYDKLSNKPIESEKDNTEEFSLKILDEQQWTTNKESINIQKDFKQLHENYTKGKIFLMKLSEENTKLKQMALKGYQMSSWPVSYRGGRMPVPY